MNKGLVTVLTLGALGGLAVLAGRASAHTEPGPRPSPGPTPNPSPSPLPAPVPYPPGPMPEDSAPGAHQVPTGLPLGGGPAYSLGYQAGQALGQSMAGPQAPAAAKFAPAVRPTAQAARSVAQASAQQAIAQANATAQSVATQGAALAVKTGAELLAHLNATAPGQESPAVVKAYQVANKIYGDGRYGPGTALDLGRRIGRRPPDPRVWPKSSNPTAQRAAYEAKLRAAGLQ